MRTAECLALILRPPSTFQHACLWRRILEHALDNDNRCKLGVTMQTAASSQLSARLVKCSADWVSCKPYRRTSIAAEILFLHLSNCDHYSHIRHESFSPSPPRLISSHKACLIDWPAYCPILFPSRSRFGGVFLII